MILVPGVSMTTCNRIDRTEDSVMPGSVHRPDTQLHKKTSPKISTGSHVLYCTIFAGNECGWDLSLSNAASRVSSVKFASNRRHRICYLLGPWTLSCYYHGFIKLCTLVISLFVCSAWWTLFRNISSSIKICLADQQNKWYQLCLWLHSLPYFCDWKVYIVSLMAAKPSAVSLLT